jgi:thiol:disulfide interchange protein DsbD
MKGREVTKSNRLPTAGRRALYAGVLLPILALLATSLWAKDEFLAPEQAYRYATRIVGDQLVITWQIEPGYYLYKKRLGVASAIATAQLGQPAWPKGENHHDEYFGDQEIYRGKVEVPVPVSFPGPKPAELAVELKLQGCADAGLCYPPMTWKTQVPLNAAGGASGAATGAPTGLQAFFKSKGASNQDEFLPPDQAFKFSAQMDRADAVALNWVIADGYYLYKQRISVTSDTANVQIGALSLPKGEPKHDESFGDTEVYHQLLDATLPVARAAGSSGTLNLKVTYQGCAEGGLCYNPITKAVAVELPPTDVATTLPPAAKSTANAPVAEQDSLAALVRDGSLFVLLATFFGGGLVLALTPCVLPMIPILSGIIVGQGDKITPLRGFSLAFTYVQGMALTYAGAGAIFALAFKTAPQASFQQPWILILFALLFIALAFAMFGAYTLQLPSALQTRLTNVSNQQTSGTYIGTFIMGALSALIVTACVAPAIVAALSVIAQAGSVARGAGALYATGLGMGMPLLIVGASAGSLLPRVGPWMDTMKSLFGVIFLGVAIYVISPLLPPSLTLLLWSALTLIAGFWIFSLKGRDGGPVPSPVRAVGLLTLIYGVLLLIGAASGGRDPLQPLAALRGGAVASGSAGSTVDHAVPFRRIKSLADLDQQVAAATAAGKPVMLDFYADWCASCKEMEKYTFTDPAVQAALANAVLLQADVTANDEQDKALLARFEIFGPPTIAFFGADGVERRNFRLVGFTPAAQFHQHVTSAFSS